MKMNLCQNEALRLSCFGCCGHSFSSKPLIKDVISKNTAEFRQFDSKLAFRDRSDTLACGICRNLIFFSDKRYGCPLHPEQNQGIDLRIGHCAHDYLCATQRKFDSWDEPTKRKFMGFLRQKDPDWYDYSIGIDSGSFLEEFMKRGLFL